MLTTRTSMPFSFSSAWASIAIATSDPVAIMIPSGISFSEYLTRKRLNVATDLLVRTDQSIREIALASGFGSMATFNRIFRAQKNCTPSQYRAIYSMALTPPIDKPIF